MAFKISFERLDDIVKCLTSSKDSKFLEELSDFLKCRKDDYYFSGRDSIVASSLKIRISQLGRILAYLNEYENKDLYEIITSVYYSAIGTGQKSIYLYGRMR